MTAPRGLSRSTRTGKLESVRIRDSEPLHFDVQPDRDEFSGIGLHLSLTTSKDIGEIRLELSVYEHNDPRAVRTVVGNS